jgi:hypothetical protein
VTNLISCTWSYFDRQTIAQPYLRIAIAYLFKKTARPDEKLS